MKRFVLLILMICLVIDDDYLIFAKPNNVKSEINLRDLKKALESTLEYSLKKVRQPSKEKCVLKDGLVYKTSQKELLFVKENSTLGADKMFRGEMEGLHAIRDTKTVLAPRPIVTGHVKNETNFFVMEYLKLVSLDNKSSAELGSQLADMHLDNTRGDHPSEKKFGFHVETYCGSIPQNNSWTKNIYHRKPFELSSEYYCKVDDMCEKKFIFNPSSFYGHHEYDIATTALYGNFPKDFYDAYHKKIPKAKGFDRRQKLYQLFHHLNNWEQFGGGNDITTVDIYEDLLMLYKTSLDLS